MSDVSVALLYHRIGWQTRARRQGPNRFLMESIVRYFLNYLAFILVRVIFYASQLALSHESNRARDQDQGERQTETLQSRTSMLNAGTRKRNGHTSRSLFSKIQFSRYSVAAFIFYENCNI